MNYELQDQLRFVGQHQAKMEGGDDEEAGKAKEKLEEYHRKSVCFSARYKAGLALGLNPEDIEDDMEDWFEECRKVVDLPTTKQGPGKVQVGTGIEVPVTYDFRIWRELTEDGDEYETVPIPENIKRQDLLRNDLAYLLHRVVKKETRREIAKLLGIAICDLLVHEFQIGTELSRDELETAYTSKKGEMAIKLKIGLLLGYSRLEILEDEIEYAATTPFSVGTRLSKEELLEIYNSDLPKDKRRIAGDFLGYFKCEMFTDDHPVISTFSGARFLSFILSKLRGKNE